MSWRAHLEASIGGLRLAVDLSGGAGALALVGPNGSGKTTVLRLLTGALRPTRGAITIGGRCVFDSERKIDVPCEGRGVGYVPQGYGLFPHLTVLENVAFGLSCGPAALPRAEREERALALLDELGCAELAQRRTARLSGGEQQRVALARALVRRPALLLFDEPLAALDTSARRAVRRFLATHLQRAGCPTLLVTHDVRDVLALDAEVCVLEAGRVRQRGSLSALRERPSSDFVAEFLGADLPPLGREP